MFNLGKIILANFIVSLGSLIGSIPLLWDKERLNKILIYLVSLSAGTLMGGAFIHLIPEASEKIEVELVMKIVLISFTTFLILEKILHWHHDHNPNLNHKTKKSIGYMNLLGDLVHNFIDGLVIAGAFELSASLGWATTVAIFMHEVPQELGDMGVLIHAGFSKKKAIVLNFVTALSAILGGVAGFEFLQTSLSLVPYLLAIAGGGFIYIAASDLVPEIKKETKTLEMIGSLLIFVAGFSLMMLIKG